MARRVWTSTITVAALVGALTVAGGAAPANADTYPSWDDVQAAKANVTAAQAEVDRINGLLTSLQTAANAAGDLAVKRLGEYGQAERVYRRLVRLTPDDPVAKAKQAAMAMLVRENRPRP